MAPFTVTLALLVGLHIGTTLLENHVALSAKTEKAHNLQSDINL